MRKLLVVCLALISAPAIAADCDYVSSHDLGSARFLDDGTVRLEMVGEAPELCGLNPGDDGPDMLVCSDETLNGFVSFAPSVPGGADAQELLVMWDHIWYKRCYEPA